MSDKTKMLTTHRQGSPEEIKNYLEDQKKPNVNKNPQCKSWRDCKCQEKVPGSVGGSCKCGEADKTIQSTTKFFSKPIAEGMVEAGKVIQKVTGGVTFAIKMALKLGSWAIPGVGKQVAKLLDKAIPLVETGNKDADNVLSKLQKYLP